MVFYKILYRGGIEHKFNVLSDAEKRFDEGNNILEVHSEGEKVLVRSKDELDLYKSLGFYKYKELIEKE